MTRLPRIPASVSARWPLYLIGAGAAVATWSGWVELGQMTGFGVVHPLPGIWDSLALNSSITLPLGVEAYGAYALQVWLSGKGSAKAQAFAKWSALGSLVLGALGQVAYHVMAAQGITHAPAFVTVLVACLPVLMLGLASTLGHLMSHHADEVEPAAVAQSAPLPLVEQAEQVDEIEPAPLPLVHPAPAALVKRPRPGTKGAKILDALDATGGDVKAALCLLVEAGVQADTAYCYHVKNGPWTALQAASASV